MKTLLLKLSILILITGLSFNAFTQTINIDSVFYSDTEICPFSEMKNMFINYNEEMLRTRYKRARADSYIVKLLINNKFIDSKKVIISK